MSERRTIALETIMPPRLGSIDPSLFPNEHFDLYSIPAYDSGEPDVVIGSSVGSAKQIVQPGDVLLSRIVPHIRRAWVVGPYRGRRTIASGEWIVLRSEFTDQRYLRHVLVSDPFHAEFMRTVSGVGGSLLRARPAYVAKITIPLPPIAEQRRVASILDKANSLRANRRAAIAALDTLAQSIFLDMFGDPKRNDMGWPVASLSDISEIVRGASPRPQGDPRFYGGPVPRLMIADITRDGWHVTPAIDSLTAEGAKRSRMVSAGSVVMAVSGNVGLVSRLAVDACVHDGFVAFTHLQNNRCESMFLVSLLHFSKAVHERNKAGAIFTNLTTTDIKSMRIPLPSVELQRLFVQRLEDVARTKAMYQLGLMKLDAFSVSLQNEVL